MTSVKTTSVESATVTGLHDRTGFLFGKIGWRATRLFAAALEPMGLRPKHYGVLNFLDANPGASQQELGATMGIDPSSVVAIIDDFERGGVAERRRDPSDRRRYAVHLTRKGKVLLHRAREAALAAEELLLADLDADERRVLHLLLVRVARTVDRTPAPDINCGPLR
ncbi:MAG TPA: MarR family winged helix-turn-helix transcriptional regulator [Solirubrobacteraceae bacterium]|nr:MarR family winged helix-turn-helix transcriptional regulator [Solirubrobacteraceae bacterium]